MTAVYIITFILSLALPIGYFLILKKQREVWMLILNISISVVNLGYLLLSLSRTEQLALAANKLSYLGQIVVIMSMFMIIVRLCGIKYTKAVPITLIVIAAIMYSMILTTGYLPWYYKDVELEIVDGAARLVKEYGPLHPTYLIYILTYFAAMLGVIFHSIKSKRVASQKLAGLMLAVVFSNIGMWLVEKVVPLNFEFLSVSYLMSEIILFVIYWMLADYVHVSDLPKVHEERQTVILVDSADRQGRVEDILSKLPEGVTLSPRQLDILEGILDGRTRKEIAADLHLSENTVKMHTSSLYKVLGVGSRDEIYAMLKNDKTTK